MLEIIICGIIFVLSFINLAIVLIVDRKIAEKGGESIFWEERK